MPGQPTPPTPEPPLAMPTDIAPITHIPSFSGGDQDGGLFELVPGLVQMNTTIVSVGELPLATGKGYRGVMRIAFDTTAINLDAYDVNAWIWGENYSDNSAGGWDVLEVYEFIRSLKVDPITGSSWSNRQTSPLDPWDTPGGDVAAHPLEVVSKSDLQVTTRTDGTKDVFIPFTNGFKRALTHLDGTIDILLRERNESAGIGTIQFNALEATQFDGKFWRVLVYQRQRTFEHRTNVFTAGHAGARCQCSGRLRGYLSKYR